MLFGRSCLLNLKRRHGQASQPSVDIRIYKWDSFQEHVKVIIKIFNKLSVIGDNIDDGRQSCLSVGKFS